MHPDGRVHGWDAMCPPSSAMRQQLPPDFKVGESKTFITSLRQSTEMCNHPEIAPIHGFLSSRDPHATDIVPIFAISKTSMHADILVPTSEAYVPWTADLPWENKTETSLLWRGSSTGLVFAANTPWRTSHRPRLVEIANAVRGSRSLEKLSILPNTAFGKRRDKALKTGLVDVQVGRANREWMDVKFANVPIRESRPSFQPSPAALQASRN